MYVHAYACECTCLHVCGAVWGDRGGGTQCIQVTHDAALPAAAPNVTQKLAASRYHR